MCCVDLMDSRRVIRFSVLYNLPWWILITKPFDPRKLNEDLVEGSHTSAVRERERESLVPSL